MSRHKVIVGLTAAVTCIAALRPVSAWDPSTECPPLPAEAVDAQMLAGELFSAAEARYQAGEPAESLKKFLCSFQIIQHENTVFNIAQIAKLSEGRETYLALLNDFVAATLGEIKVEPIREIIAEIDPDAPPAGHAAGPESPEADRTEAAAEPGPSGTEDVDSANEDSGKPLKIAGWALVGVGIAGLGAGAALQGLAGGAASDAESADTLPAYSDAESKMNSFQTGAVVGFAVGGVSALGGMVCLIIANSRDEAAMPVSLLPRGSGVVLSGRF